MHESTVGYELFSLIIIFSPNLIRKLTNHSYIIYLLNMYYVLGAVVNIPMK